MVSSIIDNIRSGLSHAYDDSDDSKLIKIINAIATEMQISDDNTDAVSNMDNIDMTLDSDLYTRWGALLMVPRLYGETEYAYRTRLKLAITSLNGGTVDTIRYSIAVGLNVESDSDSMDNIYVLDGWEYDDIDDIETVSTKTGTYLNSDLNGDSVAVITKIDGASSQDIGVWGTNLAINSDFSNGTTGWYSFASILSISDNVLKSTGDGSNTAPSIRQDTSAVLTNGHKYYVRMTARVTSNLCTEIALLAYGNSPIVSIGIIKSIISPVMNQSYIIDGIITAGTQTNNLRLLITHSYSNTTNANGSILELSKYSFVSDLTAIFGTGKEPTIPQITTMLSQYPNSWFNGKAKLTNDIITYTPNSPSLDYQSTIISASNFNITSSDGIRSNSVAINSTLRSLPNGVKDTYEIIDGVLNKVQRVGYTILNGTEVWTANDSWNTSYPTIFHCRPASATTPNWKIGQSAFTSDRFKTYGISSAGALLLIECIYCSLANNIPYIFIRADRLSEYSLIGVKAYIEAHPVTICYELATPIYTPLSRITIDTYEGITSITTNANPQVSITADFKSGIYGMVRNIDPTIKLPGNMICIIDMNDGVYDADIENVVSKAINTVKAAGVNAYISFYNYRVVYYISLEDISYATLDSIEYNKIGE